MRIILLAMSILFLDTISLSQTVANQNYLDLDGEYYVPYGGLILSNNDFIVYNGSASDIIGDKTEVGYGLEDVWLTRFDEDNLLVWDKTFGGSEADRSTCIYERENGNLLLAARTKSSTSGNFVGTNKGDFDVWVFEIDLDGNIVWQNSFGGSGSDSPTDIIVLNNQIWVLVRSSSPVSGDKTALHYGSNDMWLLQLDNQGELINQYSYGGEDYDTPIGINVLNNNIYISGFSISGISGNKTVAPFGSDDIWVLKLNENGEILNQQTFGGSSGDDATCKPITINNELFIASNSGSGESGNKLEENYGVTDIWLFVLDEDLNITRQRSYGGDESDNPITMVNHNNQIVIGSISYSCFPPTGTVTEFSNGLSDGYLVGIDPVSLDLLYQDMVGGTEQDFITEIFSITNGGVKVITRSQSGISGDKTTPSSGSGQDLWLFNYESILSLEELKDNRTLRFYPNPVVSGQTVYLKTPQERVVVYNVNGIEMINTEHTSSIELQGLLPGTYFIKTSQQEIQKLIVQ